MTSSKGHKTRDATICSSLFSFFFWSFLFPPCHPNGEFLCTLFNCLMIYASLSKLLFFQHITHAHKQQTAVWNADAQPTRHNKRLQSTHSIPAAVYYISETPNTKLTQSIISNQLDWMSGKKGTYYRDLELTVPKEQIVSTFPSSSQVPRCLLIDYVVVNRKLGSVWILNNIWSMSDVWIRIYTHSNWLSVATLSWLSV